MKQKKDNRKPENWGGTKKKIAKIIKELTGQYPNMLTRTYAGRHQRASGACIWAANMPNLREILGIEGMADLLRKYKTFEITESGVVHGDWWFDGKDKKGNSK